RATSATVAARAAAESGPAAIASGTAPTSAPAASVLPRGRRTPSATPTASARVSARLTPGSSWTIRQYGATGFRTAPFPPVRTLRRHAHARFWSGQEVRKEHTVAATGATGGQRSHPFPSLSRDDGPRPAPPAPSATHARRAAPPRCRRPRARPARRP